jgi:predicted transcriptional regulator
MITVDEIMTTKLFTLPATATLADAIRIMAEESIRHIPIMDAEGKLEGLVTRHDVLATLDSTLRAKTERRDPATIPLVEIRMGAPTSVAPRSSSKNTSTVACRS